MQVFHNHFTRKLTAIAIFALLLCSLSANATIYYVDAARADNTGAGTSWATAKRDLQEAINIAASGDEVRVAAGTYKPTHDPFFGSTTPPDPRDKTFYIKDGIGIYGGYDAATGLRTEAPFGGLGVTVLSGDFLGNDIVTGSGATLAITNNTENAYHVVLSSAPSTGGIGVTVDGFTIKGGNANVSSSSITVNGNSVSRNYGAGIATNYGTNTLSNNILSGNYANAKGGGIYTNYGANTLSNNTISGNYTNYEGGGIYAYLGTNTLTNNTISENYAYSIGGGIATLYSTNTLTNNTLSGNYANDGGGGIYTKFGTNTLSNNTLSGNYATNGGGIYTNDGNNTLNNNTLLGNYANYGGGGIATNYGTNTLNNNTFSGNYTGDHGGGIYTYSGTNTLSNNTLSGNYANYGGGGISIDDGNNTLSNNTLLGNYANSGGGVFTYLGTNTLSNNTLSGNSASYDGGGGIATYYGTNTLSNNTLSGNSASYDGGGIATYYGTNTLSNNTLSGNAASDNGGGVFTYLGTNTLSNNIFWANKQGSNATVVGADYYAYGTNDNTFKNNLLQLAASNYAISNTGNYAIGIAASGNIFATDPLFVNAADIDGADNIHRTADDGLRLKPCSPAINAGTNIGAPTTDITGTATIETTKDIGAYENESFASYTLSSSALTANDECITTNGWTQYYNTTNKNLLLAIKKNGNSIGTIGDGTFSLTVGGSGTTNLGRLGTPTPYTNVDNWYAMNRYWNVTPTTQPTSDVNIRFYYQNADYTAVQAASGIAAETNMIFYKINGAGNPDPTSAHAGTAATPATAYNAAGYWEYTNGAAPSSSNWVAGVFNTMAYAETVAASFSGGGGGAGTAGGSALPVKLLSFTGHKDKNLHRLYWTTASEQNASHFEIEVASPDPSQVGGTGATLIWKNIGNVRAAGNSNTTRHYTFTNIPTLPSFGGAGGGFYYRLKIVDFDGLFEYSNVITIKENSKTANVKCYPNPTDNILYIVAVDYTQPVAIIDELGRVLQTHTTTPNSIDLSGLPAGIYILKIGSNYTKIVKQ